MAWDLLGTTSLGAAADLITVDNLDVRTNLLIQCDLINHDNTGSDSPQPFLRFNGTTASDYSNRIVINGGSDLSETSQAQIKLGDGFNHNCFINIYAINQLNKEKLTISDANYLRGSSGAGEAPQQMRSYGKWDRNDQITRVDIENLDTGDFKATSTVNVFGWEA